MNEIKVPILIVGGGGCGLALSIFLSRLGIQHLLVERHQTTSHLPKAHYLNQRTMEILRQFGLAEAIYAVGTPIGNMSKVRWRTSLGGEEFLDARTFYEMDAFGGGSLLETYTRDSPCLSSNYPQIRLEPLLRDWAGRLAPGAVRFNHTLTSLVQSGDGVRAEVESGESGESFGVSADYVVAADGGKSVGAMLGNVMQGISGLGRIATSHVTADLSAWWDDACLITWFINPIGSGALGSGAMVPMGPTWGKHCEEWVIHFAFAPNDPQTFDEEGVVPRLRELLKLPDLQMTVHKVNNWELEGVVAEKFRMGRVFFAGDAAHRHPPTTGLGLNSAIQDAHNLAWKLAAVVKGSAGPALLDSFEPERKPVAQRNVEWALFTAMNHQVLDAGMGLSPLHTPEMRRASLEALFSETPMGETLRGRAAEVIRTQRCEFQAHDIEIGYHYEQGALIADGTPAPARDPMGHVHVPSTRPGHRLPHAWVTRAGERCSTHDFVGDSGNFALIFGDEGNDWAKAAAEASAAAGVTVTPMSIGDGGAFHDENGQWAAVSGLSASGAILVRPDNHIAWRATTAPGSRGAVLTQVLRKLLGQAA